MSYTSVIKTDRESDNPVDSIQTIVWDEGDKDLRTFFTAGWDGYLRVYSIEGSSQKRLQRKFQHYMGHPITSLAVSLDKLAFMGLASGEVVCLDLKNTNNILTLAKHQAMICKVVWVEKHQALLSFGFDCVVKAFSMQAQNSNFQVGQYSLPAKTHTVAFSFPYVLIGAQDGRCALINVQRFSNTNLSNQYQYIFEQVHGLVKFQSSALLTPKGRILFGTHDGRLVSTTFTQSHSGVRIHKPLLTRLQKKQSYRKDMIGQINGLDLAVKQGKYEIAIVCGTFQSLIFNLQKNVKTKSITSSTSSTDSCTTAVSISPDCEYYALAYGTDWSKGLDELTAPPSVRIVVGKINTSDCTTMVSSYTR